MTEIQEGSKVARETDPRALASMASFGLLLNEAEVCLLADFTCDLLVLLARVEPELVPHYDTAQGLSDKLGLGPLNSTKLVPDIRAALDGALSSEDATRPTQGRTE